MSITTFFSAVRKQWHELSKEFWPPSPQELTCAEIERLDADLARRQQRLIHIRRRANLLSDRLALQRQQSHSANEQVPGADPNRLAQSIERLEAQIARCEAVYTRQCQEFTRRKQFRQALASGRVAVVDVICGLEREEES